MISRCKNSAMPWTSIRGTPKPLYKEWPALIRNAGDKTEAEAASYIKAAELRPDDWNGYNNLGNFYDDNGRHKEAIAQFRHALQLTPDNSVSIRKPGLSPA